MLINDNTAFLEDERSEEEKLELVEMHFRKILEVLGMDLTCETVEKTPRRFAKMLLQELCSGLNADSFPKMTTQSNTFQYDQMLMECNISIKSICEHHFIPFLGFCHIGYVPKSKIIGLSKLNRVADFFSRRPQVQERLTKQIRETLVQVLGTDDVIVVVDAVHLCVKMRGIQDERSLTRTTDRGGIFLKKDGYQEFLSQIPALKDLKW